MHPILRNVLAVIAGLLVGGSVNMAIVTLGPMIIPPPEGADVTTMEGLSESIHLFEPQHFISPFLAHALGTLVGAWLAAMIAVSHRAKLAIGVGAFFLIGGVMNVMMLPSPMWFNALDLIVAYIPMGWLGGKMAARRK